MDVPRERIETGSKVGESVAGEEFWSTGAGHVAQEKRVEQPAQKKKSGVQADSGDVEEKRAHGDQPGELPGIVDNPHRETWDEDGELVETVLEEPIGSEVERVAERLGDAGPGHSHAAEKRAGRPRSQEEPAGSRRSQERRSPEKSDQEPSNREYAPFVPIRPNPADTTATSRNVEPVWGWEGEVVAKSRGEEEIEQEKMPEGGMDTPQADTESPTARGGGEESGAEAMETSEVGTQPGGEHVARNEPGKEEDSHLGASLDTSPRAVEKREQKKSEHGDEIAERPRSAQSGHDAPPVDFSI